MLLKKQNDLCPNLHYPLLHKYQDYEDVYLDFL